MHTSNKWHELTSCSQFQLLMCVSNVFLSRTCISHSEFMYSLQKKPLKLLSQQWCTTTDFNRCTRIWSVECSLNNSCSYTEEAEIKGGFCPLSEQGYKGEAYCCCYIKRTVILITMPSEGQTIS